MRFLSWLIPQETQFFDMIESQSKNVLKGVCKLEEMLKDYTDLEKKGAEIKRIEEDGDQIVHNIHAELNKTFITPIDREDISTITSSLDDILDITEDVSERLILYEVKKPPKHMIDMAVNLHKATNNVNEAIINLRSFRNAEKMRQNIKEIHDLENKGDTLLRKAMSELFKKGDPVEIIKMKELYDSIERGVDRCEDAGDVVGDILVKYT
jgi:predicted phosphate transport protein (TIGR00153 family)